MSESTPPIPSIAVVGHPNQGKSSLIATLTENPRVAIDSRPGTTLTSKPYPIRLDGIERLRFWDTPGFQRPSDTLAYLEPHAASHGHLSVSSFLQQLGHLPGFDHEKEIFSALSQCSAAVMVFDSSNPITRHDRHEMRIMELLNIPCMAVLNPHETPTEPLPEEWRKLCSKHFNLVRDFNTHAASFEERKDLLQALAQLNQHWVRELKEVIHAYDREWNQRIQLSAHHIADLLWHVMTHHLELPRNPPRSNSPQHAPPDFRARFWADLDSMEKRTFDNISVLFHHSKQAVTHEGMLQFPLHSRESWSVLGIARSKLILLGMAGGGAAGGVLDASTGGLTLGIPAATGAVIGGITAALSGSRIASFNPFSSLPIPGLRRLSLGRHLHIIGPIHNAELFFQVLDRCLVHFRHMARWAHAEKDRPSISGKQGYTHTWPEDRRRIAMHFFKECRPSSFFQPDAVATANFLTMLEQSLHEIVQEKI